MKKIIAIVLSALLISAVAITAFAYPSPATSAKLTGLTIVTNDAETEVPESEVDDYAKIVHVHESTGGHDLYEVGQKLTNDGKIGEVMGEEYDGSKLIQLFNFEYTTKFPQPGDLISVTYKIDSSTFSEDMDIVLVKLSDGEWVQHEHVRAYNGYITITAEAEELGTVWGILVTKAPVSPPTGDTFNAQPFALVILFSLFAIGFASKKYFAHK